MAEAGGARAGGAAASGAAPARHPDRLGAVLFCAAAGALALLFYREFVFQPGRILFGTDMLDQGFPLRQFGVEEIRSGRGFPLWNPYVYGGVPYLAILPGPVFYPTSLLYLAIPLGRAIGWTFVLHTALAGGFAFFAGRSLRLGPRAAAVTGLSFMFTGIVVSTLYGGHDGRMFAMVLIPLAFGALERGLAGAGTKWFLVFGLAVALQIFTPHVQVMYFSSLALSLWALLRIAERTRTPGGGTRLALRLGGLTALGFLVAALVGAVQLLSTFRLLAIAVRGGMGEGGYDFASSWAFPAPELSAFLLPDLVGSLRTYWGTNPFKLHTEYLGAVPLGLAIVALASGRRDRRVWWLAGIVALGTLFALGAATPVHRLAYWIVPLISRFRAANLMIGPVALCVALLAGLGWQAAEDEGRAGGGRGPGGGKRDGAASRRAGKGGREEGKRPPAGGGPGTLLPWLLASPLLFLALWAALFPEGLQRWVQHAWFPAGWRGAPEGAVGPLRMNGWLALLGVSAALAAARGVARGRLPETTVLVLLAILVADLWRVDARYLHTTTPEEAFPTDPVVEHLQTGLEPGERVYPLPGTYGSNELMIHRIPSVTGSQNFRLEWTERLFGGLGLTNLARPVLWALADIRFFVSPQPVTAGGLITPVEETSGRHLARLEVDAPHAFFPERVEAAPDTAAALARVLAVDDPGALAVVEAEEAPPAGAGEARVERWTPDEIVLRATAERAGLLFVSEIWHPSWRAAVDGREMPVLRTNVAFRGVVVPAGSHEVRLTYSAAEFRAGFVVSAVSSLLAVGGLLLLGVRERGRCGAAKDERVRSGGGAGEPAA